MPGSGTTLVTRLCQWIECETCKLDPIPAIALGQRAWGTPAVRAATIGIVITSHACADQQEKLCWTDRW